VGTYVDDVDDSSCSDCSDENCKVCDSNGDCLICSIGYILDKNDDCVTECPDGEFIDVDNNDIGFICADCSLDCIYCMGDKDNCIPAHFTALTSGTYGGTGACSSDTFVFGYEFVGISNVYLTNVDQFGLVDGYYNVDDILAEVFGDYKTLINFECWENRRRNLAISQTSDRYDFYGDFIFDGLDESSMLSINGQPYGLYEFYDPVVRRFMHEF